MARYQAVLVSGGDLGSPVEALLEDLVRFLTAGLEAPARARSQREGPSARPRPGAAGRGAGSKTALSQGRARKVNVDPRPTNT